MTKTSYFKQQRYQKKKPKYSNRIIKLSLFITCFFYNISAESMKIKDTLSEGTCRIAFYSRKKEILLNPLRSLIETIQNSETSKMNTFQIVGETDLQNSSNEPVFHQTKKETFILNPNYYNALIQILSPIITSHRKGVIITSSLAEAEQLKTLLKATFANVEFEVSHFLLSSQENQKILENANKAHSHYIIIPRVWEGNMQLPQTSAYITVNTNIPIKQMFDEAQKTSHPTFRKKNNTCLFFNT